MIYEVLEQGADNAQTGRSLCRLLGITPRELTAAIEKERRQGKPICASTGANPGYYIPQTRQDMQEYCRSLQRRAGEIFKTRAACIKTLDQLPNGGGEN